MLRFAFGGGGLLFLFVIRVGCVFIVSLPVPSVLIHIFSNMIYALVFSMFYILLFVHVCVQLACFCVIVISAMLKMFRIREN